MGIYSDNDSFYPSLTKAYSLLVPSETERKTSIEEGKNKIYGDFYKIICLLNVDNIDVILNFTQTSTVHIKQITQQSFIMEVNL